jgi:hypothetical protein
MLCEEQYSCDLCGKICPGVVPYAELCRQCLVSLQLNLRYALEHLQGDRPTCAIQAVKIALGKVDDLI